MTEDNKKYGYVSAFRSIRHHWLWKDKPFSYGQAWIDMVLMANHKDKDVIFSGDIVKVERGSFITSQEKLKLNWGWKRKRFDKFVSLLKKTGMVLIENRAYQGTYITICNYETYQNQGQAIEQAEGQARGKRGTSGGAINNKENKINKVNKLFIKPTLEEITQYCKERKNAVNPQKWLDHYTSNGWMVGRNPMKDWKSAVRTWETNKFNNGGEMSSEERGAEVARLLAESRG